MPQTSVRAALIPAGFVAVSMLAPAAASARKPASVELPDAFFEMLVTAAEESTSKTREAVAGVGQRAAFAANPQTVAIVQRTDGVARIAANGPNKAQTIAVARAVATP